MSLLVIVTFSSLQLSIYFTAKPEYYNFIKKLEDEGEQYRLLHHKLAEESQKTKQEFRATWNRINAAMNTIKPPVRGIRTADVPIITKKHPEKRAVTQTAARKPRQIFGQIQGSRVPTAVYPNQMPARTNGAQRILNPRRLLKYKEDNREPPMLIGKGVDSLNHDMLNMASTSLSSYSFDIVD